MEDNFHLRDFLKNIEKYLKAGDAAALVEGEWGTGKTTILRECLPRNSIVLVSLADKSNPHEVYRELFFACAKGRGKFHRFSERLKDAALTARGFGSLAHLVPIEIKLQPEDFDSKIVVLDDLERSSLSIEELVGVIIRLTEILSVRVVLASNISQLDDKFSSLQEKVIGRRFQVTAPIEKVVDAEVEAIETPGTKDFIRNHRDAFIGIFNTSGVVSLRVLKRAIKEVVALVEDIENDQSVSDSVVSNAAQQIFICATIFMGGCDPLNSLLNEDEPIEGDNYLSKLELANTYGTEVFISALPDGVIYDRIVRGQRDAVSVQNAIIEVSAQQTGHSPGMSEWRALSSHDTISDEIILENLKASLELLNNYQVVNLGLIAHFVSIYMLHSRTGLVESTYEELEEKFVAYVIELVKAGTLEGVNDLNDHGYRNDSWGGYSFYVLEEYRSYFESFVHRVEIEIEEMQEEAHNKATAKVLQNKNSAEDLKVFLTEFKNSGGGTDLDALTSIEPSEFFNWLMSLPRQELGKLFSEYRISLKHASSQDANRWLESVISLAQNEYNNLSKSKQYTLSRFFRFVIGVEINSNNAGENQDSTS